MLFQYRRDSISVRERVVLASRKFRRQDLNLRHLRPEGSNRGRRSTVHDGIQPFGESDVREVADRNSRLLSSPLVTEQPALGASRADPQ
jgi:hypothetical protein